MPAARLVPDNGELQEVNFSFWLGISLIVISVLIQTRRIIKAELSVR